MEILRLRPGASATSFFQRQWVPKLWDIMHHWFRERFGALSLCLTPFWKWPVVERLSIHGKGSFRDHWQGYLGLELWSPGSCGRAIPPDPAVYLHHVLMNKKVASRGAWYQNLPFGDPKKFRETHKLCYALVEGVVPDIETSDTWQTLSRDQLR